MQVAGLDACGRVEDRLAQVVHGLVARDQRVQPAAAAVGPEHEVVVGQLAHGA
jgi:hypothetical protein